jgi:hypothetical protein
MVLRYIVKKNIVMKEVIREHHQRRAQQKFDEAVLAAEDAKLRRKFSTKFKLNIHPSEEQLEMVRNTYGVTTWYAEGDRAGEYAVATQYPDGALEDKYGYTDGIPDEQLGVHDGCVTRASESFEGNDSPFSLEMSYDKETFEVNGSKSISYSEDGEIETVTLSGKFAKEYAKWKKR